MSQALVDAFEHLKRVYKPNVVSKQTVFYVSLGDAADQKWIMTLTPAECTAVPGKTEAADVVLKMAENDFVRMVKGDWVPGALDFMRGKIKTNNVEGLKLLKDCFA
ncbi:MAG: SCP2 sterol-binding domain-containing protein [Planctomycetota bacterium]|nr:SCP2 sterol-binding domain-containing protein [Planctomycetota bacterium]